MKSVLVSRESIKQSFVGVSDQSECEEKNDFGQVIRFDPE